VSQDNWSPPIIPTPNSSFLRLFFGMRPLWATLTAVTALLTATGCGGGHPSFNGVVYDPPEPAPAMQLTRGDGSSFDLREQRGSVVLVFFGYTHCPDICPMTLSDWVKVKRALGGDASRVQFVFVSVDPARDTPALTQRYVSEFDPSFIGLTGDSAQVARAENLFHVTSSREKVQSANGYAVGHAAQSFVISPQGRLRLLYPPGIPTDAVVSDIKKLLHHP
jgi:protein SCO1/2